MNFKELDHIVSDIKRNIYSSIRDKKILNEEVLAYELPMYFGDIYLSQKLETIDNVRMYIWSEVGKSLEEEGYTIKFNISREDEKCIVIIQWKNLINENKEKFDACKDYIKSKLV